jgi:protoheme IX farnesyltransferase
MSLRSRQDLTDREARAFRRRRCPRDYFALLKPRVMSLVVFTALRRPAGGAGRHPSVMGFSAILCIAIGAARRAR